MKRQTACAITPAFYRLLGGGNRLLRLASANLAAVLSERGHTCFQYNNDWVPIDGMTNWAGLYATPKEAFLGIAKNPEHAIWKEVRQVLEKVQPDWILVTVFSGAIEQAARISEVAKELGIKTAAGGAHPTTVGNIKMGGLRPVDGNLPLTQTDLGMPGQWNCIVVGDGEDVVCDIVEGKRSGIIMSGNARDLNALPYPKRDEQVGPPSFHPREMDFGGCLTSRGCRERCSFCAQNLVAGESMRWLKPERVLGELKDICYGWAYGKTPVPVTFYDDVATLAEVRFRRICEMIIEEDLDIEFRIETRADCLSDETLHLLKRAGCVRIKIGIESLNQRIIDEMHKNIKVETVIDTIRRTKKYGIPVTGNFIVGWPSQSNRDAEEDIEKAEALDLEAYSVSVMTPYFGTLDYDRFGGVGAYDPAELFHTNVSLLSRSGVKPETLDKFLKLNEGRSVR